MFKTLPESHADTNNLNRSIIKTTCLNYLSVPVKIKTMILEKRLPDKKEKLTVKLLFYRFGQ